MNFFVLKVSEDREVSVKNNLKLTYPKLTVLLPFEEAFTNLGTFRVRYFNRTFPGYLILKAFDIPVDQQRGLDSVPDSEKLSYSSSTKGNVLLPEEGFEVYDKEYNLDSAIESLTNNLVVLAGPYRGKKCKLKSVKGDMFTITVESRNLPEIRLPIWYIGTILEELRCSSTATEE